MAVVPREILSLDAGWLFHPGDIDPTLSNTHLAAYMLNKAGYARNGGKHGWDDSDWRTLDLPHDWSVEGEFSQDHHVDAGFLPRGVAWYRRHLVLDESDRGRHLSITFDGVATHCTVYVNGHLLHRNFCGYTPFTVDITDVARFGDDDVNTIAVRVDATYAEGWWYEGAGIYRHVRLTKASPLHITPNGVFIRPERREGRGWDVWLETTLRNDSDAEVECHIASELGDGTVRTFGPIPPRKPVTVRTRLPVGDPALWSAESPNLHTIRTELRIDAKLVDEVFTTFGFRTTRFDPDHGFFLNDQPVKLKGFCIHQDHAGVGVAVPDSIVEFRVRRLKEMGCNAIRCAHHPPARELLDVCDRLGMLVMDENRNFGSSPEHLEQLRAMVRRDRNHPSVILWSLCNEEAIQGTPTAAAIARTMTAEVLKHDPSRPVMAAVSGGILNDGALADAMPLVGINYQLPVNDQFHAKKPTVPVLAAETTCVYATRGTYETSVEKHYFAADDSATAPWGATARETWRFVAARPWLAGLFAWTGFDYRGEPPHHWPCTSSQYGVLDLCGFEKDGFYLHKAFLDREGEPFVHLLPHWNWPGREGQRIRVLVYTNCDEAELFLNGESLGRKRVDPIEMAEWIVPYRAGELRAVGWRGGSEAEAHVETTGPVVALGLEVHPAFAGVIGDAVPVTAFAVDAAGRRVPDADHAVAFAVEEPGKILGVGNGDPVSLEPSKASSRRLFRGLAQVIAHVRKPMELTATSPDLRPATLRVVPTLPPPRPTVPPARRKVFLTDWRMSPITPTRPDPLVSDAALAQDMNSWERVEPGRPQPQWQYKSGYAVYRANFTPPKRLTAKGGRLVFRAVGGSAEVCIDGTRAATKADAGTGPVEAPFPVGSGPMKVAVVVHGATADSGLLGRVEAAG